MPYLNYLLPDNEYRELLLEIKHVFFAHLNDPNDTTSLKSKLEKEFTKEELFDELYLLIINGTKFFTAAIKEFLY